ncbi:MAG TPA: SapC family protein [Gammaproteobacteria bacterium]|nr:SapC family protein [Gammaproteobacteria bacterium]
MRVTSPPPGYETLVPLDRQRHRGLGVIETKRGAVAARLHSIPIAALEIIPAARHYPVVFAKDRDSGSWVVVAVTGYESGRNLFVTTDGTWLPHCYVPAYVRRWPFYTALLPKTDAGQTVVCVDETALEPSRLPLFDARGEPTPAWTPYETLLAELEAARLQTERFIATIESLGLLEPFVARAVPRAGEERVLRGMYRVNETRLVALDGRTLKRLAKHGELSRLYAHIMSLENFRMLMERSGMAAARN